MSTEPIDLENYAVQLGERARAASRALAAATSDQKNNWLRRSADRLSADSTELLAANRVDIDAARSAGLAAAPLDRLSLNPTRIAAIAQTLQAIAELDDPVHERMETTTRPSGLRIDKIRVPIGVVFFIYESRPNVTADAAALCVKSGNAVILRGGKEAMHTNRAIHERLRQALGASGLPEDAVQLVQSPHRKLVDDLLHLDSYIDLAIPRGGESLIRRVAGEARMPVMKHYQGICHVFVHRAADLDMARRIVLNSKCQRPGVCNAAESLLVDGAIAERFVPAIVAELQQAGVEVRGCPTTAALAPGIIPASDADYATEYLDLKISLRVVEDLPAAVEHIRRFGSAHTDAIVTRDDAAAREFALRVDSAAVIINASTRFNDGGEFGFGAEIGISTDKYHARGPCGLRELTSYKYVVHGSGQTRT